MLLKKIRSDGKKYGLTFNMDFEANSNKSLRAQISANDQGLGRKFSSATYKAFYENSKNIGNEDIVLEIADSVGLDLDLVKKALTSNEYQERLLANIENARSKGIKKFPTFVINDEHILAGSPTEKKFRELLDSLS